MKYNGFYFWMFKGPMKKVLAKKYGKAYVLEVMKKSKQVYRELVEQADDIGDDNPMAYNELFALAFVAPYVASGKKIPPGNDAAVSVPHQMVFCENGSEHGQGQS